MFVLVVSLPHRMYLILYTSYFWCDIFHHITDRVELYKNIQYLFYWFLLCTTTSSRGRHFTGDSPPETCLTQYKHADLKHQCHPVIQPAGPTSIQMTHQLMRFWSRDPLGPSRLHSVDSAGTEKKVLPPQLCCYWPAVGNKRVDKWIRFISGADWLQRARCQSSHSERDRRHAAQSTWVRGAAQRVYKCGVISCAR